MKTPIKLGVDVPSKNGLQWISSLKLEVSGPLRKLSVLILLALMLSGCADAERQKIVGVWEIETADKLMDRVGPATDENEIPEAPAMSIHFLNDGTLKTSTRIAAIDNEKSGTWELIVSEQNPESFLVRCHLAMQTTEHEVEWVDRDTIMLTPPNMAGLSMKLKFVRKK